MAGGNHHPANGALRLDGKRNGRRRGRLRREHHLKTIPGQNFSGGPGKSVRKKPAVKADDDFQFAPENFGLLDFWTSDFQ